MFVFINSRKRGKKLTNKLIEQRHKTDLQNAPTNPHEQGTQKIKREAAKRKITTFFFEKLAMKGIQP